MSRGRTTTLATCCSSSAAFCLPGPRDRHSRHLYLLPLVTWAEYSCKTLHTQVAGFPRITPLKLSEKSRTPLQRSLAGHRNGTFQAVLAFVYWPNLRSKPCSDPLSDSFSRTLGE